MPIKSFTLSNGDTLDWVRLDFEAYSVEGKLIKAVIDMTIPERIFDFKRKCWFIPADVAKALVAGVQSLINQEKLKDWDIKDNRISVKDFNDFFTEEAKNGVSAPEPESKDKLVAKLITICTSVGINIAANIGTTGSALKDLKPSYRKAALALHPDRNNGDGSKMAELNVIWTQLQPMLEE